MPTGSPRSAAAACAVEVRITGMPHPAAMRAASILVTMPPVPTPALPLPPTSMSAMREKSRTVAMRRLVGSAGSPV